MKKKILKRTLRDNFHYDRSIYYMVYTHLDIWNSPSYTAWFRFPKI